MTDAKSAGAAVRARHLTRRFGAFTAVDSISFAVRRGEIYGFLGPNGSGKTTTIRMVLGLLPPTSGEIWVLGQRAGQDGSALRRRLGYMSQRFSLYPELTVAENLRFFARTYGVSGERFRRRQAEVLAMAGIAGRENQLTGTLSGGWKQRLALGTAMLHEPEILFLDEPTAGVDPVSRRAFWDLLYDLAAGGTTIFVTTHYMDEAEHCHRLAFIFQGRLIAEDTPRELRSTGLGSEVLEVDCDQPERAVGIIAEAAVGAIPGISEATLHGAVVHVVAHKAAEVEGGIRRALADAGIAPRTVERVEPTLEDVFVSLVRRQQSTPGHVQATPSWQG